MTFKELNREQIIQLKQSLLCEVAMDEDGHLSLSWGELASADELVSDELVEQAYGDCVFTEEDFF